MNNHFKTSEVVDLLDLSRRQLQYWAKTGLVEPLRPDAWRAPPLRLQGLGRAQGHATPDRRGRIGPEDPQERRRPARPAAPGGPPALELVLVATGDVVLVPHDETVFEAITGQEWVFPVAAFEREVSEFCVRQGSRRSSPLRGLRAERSRRPDRRAPVLPVSSGISSGISSGLTAKRGDEPKPKPLGPTVRSAKGNRKRLFGKTG